ncbi:MAG: alpha-galactosidase [Lentisphaeria bacterium]|nr:alpha-galactosidase [Lentisphaeria bacterium]
MSVTFNEKNRVFKLDAGDSTCAFMVEPSGYVAHLHYGGKISSDAFEYLYRRMDRAFSPAAPGTTSPESRDVIPQEFGTNGVGDFHAPSAIVRQENGHTVTDFKYRSHRIYKGKPALEGLPATFGSDDDVDTLELSLYDAASDVEFILFYSAFRRFNAIARSVKVVNHSKESVRLEKISSASLDFTDGRFDLIHLPGAWGRERAVERHPVNHSRTVLESVRGLSSHQQNPFFALAAPETTETAGEVYGAALLYSGNFAAEIELDQFNLLRAQIGINERTFEWVLAPGESFVAPEVLLVYSQKGLGGMSRTYHDMFRNHLIRSYWKDLKRPILVNNWEATYFDFNAEKLLSIAKDAAELGIEMLVLDDGWFGKRDDDHTSLGDWFVYESKLKGGLGRLVEGVNKLGLKFGLWFEPEMISRDSELYRRHPEWSLHVPGRGASEGRNQLVLDMSRPEVVDYLFDSICAILDSANIEYIKWDANRHLTEVGSAAVPPERQKEISHRYVLGMYELHERLLKRYPKLLIEGCSGGGGRFDAGMLYYVPQIWTSDDTDALERLKIQYGTSMLYPCSTMGAHISDCPNHQTHRTNPFETRGIVALSGTFGYELDLNKMNDEERRLIREQVAAYHKYNHIVAGGDFHRLTDPFSPETVVVIWEHVAADRSEALVTMVQPRNVPNGPVFRVRLRGLDPEAVYEVEHSGERFTGEMLMNAGLNVPRFERDGGGALYHLIRR